MVSFVLDSAALHRGYILMRCCNKWQWEESIPYLNSMNEHPMLIQRRIFMNICDETRLNQSIQNLITKQQRVLEWMWVTLHLPSKPNRMPH